MPSSSPKLRGLNLDGLLAEGLREVAAKTVAAWEPPSPEELTGVLPRYEIVRLIGRGGMGAVYEAKQVDLGRRVAVKILPPELGANEAFAERFRREAQALGRLEHANILNVFDFGESTAGHLFFTMPYVEGGDLGARLKSGALEPVEALRMVKEICAALEAAHAQGIIHRDIKPSNILLTKEGAVKVADFGIAMLDNQPKERLTHTGIAVGTLEYAAPEQTEGAAVDSRSDLYSVGVICYEVLTGKLPRGIFDPPSKVNAAVDPAMDAVVRTAMQSDPARRYQSATDFRTALNRADEGRMRPARRWSLALVALVLLAASAAAFHWWPGKAEALHPVSTAADDPQSSPPSPVVSTPPAAPVETRTSIVAWGRNQFGESTADLSDARAIAAGDAFTMALRSNGTVAAWGQNEHGQLDVPKGLSGVQAIAAGNYHAVVLKTDGTVVAWGRNSHGQIDVPAGLRPVKAIAAGNEFTLALQDDGTVVAWGHNDPQHLGVPADLSGVQDIAAGYFHALALKQDGTVVAWGDGGEGRTGVPGGLHDVRAIAAGWFHSVALKNDGTVVAWGGNEDGQTNVPAGLAGVRAIAAGYRHTVALKEDGTVVAWGATSAEYNSGQAIVPVGLTGVQEIAAGFYHSVALVRGKSTARLPTPEEMESEKLFALLEGSAATTADARKWAVANETAGLAITRQFGGDSAALVHYTSWISRLEQKRALAPNDPRWMVALAATLIRRGNILEGADPTVAVKTFELSSALYRSALKASPDDPKARKDVVNSLCKVLDSHRTVSSAGAILAACREVTAACAEVPDRRDGEEWFDQYLGVACAKSLEVVSSADPSLRPQVQAAARAALAAIFEQHGVDDASLAGPDAAARADLQRMAQ